MAWPRILIDFAQTRAELAALEAGANDPRVLAAIQIPAQRASVTMQVDVLQLCLAAQS